MNFKNIFSAILVASMLFSASAADFLAPSQSAPGGLATNKVPQFVTIGFDDNSSAEGMQWILDYLRTKTNPTGLGNSKTYDGAPVRVSFYTNTRAAFDSLADVPSLVTQLTQAVSDGHEMANHTASHLHGREFTAEQWAAQISTCTNDLLNAGIVSNKSQIQGFRTPFLEYGDLLYQGLMDSGLIYDCSIEEGSQSDQDGSNFLWPYTLDNGSPGHEASWLANPQNPDAFSINGVAGLWELANHNVIIPPDGECANYGVSTGFRAQVANRLTGKTSGGWFDGIVANGKMTGFDYNMWARFDPDTSSPTYSLQAAMTKAEFIAVLKYTLDLRLQGNRAPFMFGAHSQYYTAANNSSYPNATDVERREAIEAFIDYALSKSEVRIVTAAKIIDWMRDPVALDDVSGTKYTLTVNSGTGDGDYSESAQVTITADAAPTGKVFDKWTGDVATISNVNAASTMITIGTSALTVTATYKDKPVEDTTGIIFDDFANAYGDGNDQTYLGAAYGTALYNQDSCYMGGGYMYVYSDTNGSVITAGDGTTEIGTDNADAMVENGMLHVHIKTSGSTEEYPYATIEMPILDSGSAYHDFSTMTALVVKARGTGKVRVAFNTKDVSDLGQGWGFYGAELTLNGSDSTYVISTSDLKPEEGAASDTLGWDWNHGASEVKHFTISAVTGDAEVYVSSIKLRGMAYSDLFTGYVDPTPVSISMNSVKNHLPVSFTTNVSGATTTLKYNVSVSGKVDVKIFDLRGKMVANFSDSRGVGIFQKNLNLSSGIYSIRVKTVKGIMSSRFTVAK